MVSILHCRDGLPVDCLIWSCTDVAGVICIWPLLSLSGWISPLLSMVGEGKLLEQDVPFLPKWTHSQLGRDSPSSIWPATFLLRCLHPGAAQKPRIFHQWNKICSWQGWKNKYQWKIYQGPALLYLPRGNKTWKNCWWVFVFLAWKKNLTALVVKIMVKSLRKSDYERAICSSYGSGVIPFQIVGSLHRVSCPAKLPLWRMRRLTQ